MNIEPINTNTAFKAKYLPSELNKNICVLKSLMRGDTVIIQGREVDQIINTRALSINGGEAVFKDGKFLARKNKENKLVPYGTDTAMIEFGNVRIISNGSGQIIEHKKPLLKKWDTIFEQANNYIKYAVENYKNNNVIIKLCNKKDTLNANGKKQAQKLIELFESLNPYAKKQ